MQLLFLNVFYYYLYVFDDNSKDNVTYAVTRGHHVVTEKTHCDPTVFTNTVLLLQWVLVSVSICPSYKCGVSFYLLQVLLHVLFEHAAGYALFAVKEVEEIGMLLPQVGPVSSSLYCRLESFFTPRCSRCDGVCVCFRWRRAY